MPATEETYRKQSSLHIVFAVSSIVMALVIVWMILADHLRPWKTVQRDFQKIETDKLSAAEKQKARELDQKYADQIKVVDERIVAADAIASNNARKIRDIEANISSIQGRVDRLDTDAKFQKAELDSQRSFYDGMIDRDEVGRAQEYLQTAIIPSEQKFGFLARQLEFARRDLARAAWIGASSPPRSSRSPTTPPSAPRRRSPDFGRGIR